MTVSNIGIGSVFSDPFGKSAQAIMKEVLESDIIEDEKILKCIHGSCKNKDKILDSIKHCNIETDQRFKMNESMTHMEELQVHINNCEIEIMKRAHQCSIDSCTSPNYQVSALYLQSLLFQKSE